MHSPRSNKPTCAVLDIRRICAASRRPTARFWNRHSSFTYLGTVTPQSGQDVYASRTHTCAGLRIYVVFSEGNKHFFSMRRSYSALHGLAVGCKTRDETSTPSTPPKTSSCP